MDFLIRGQQNGKILLYSGQSSNNSRKNIEEELAVNMIGSDGGGDGELPSALDCLDEVDDTVTFV